MCTKLPESPLEERLRWVLPIINKEVRLIDAAKLFTGGKRTLERWVSDYRKNGEEGLMPKSTRPGSQPNETPIRIKERIIELRKKTKLCAEKLNYRIKKEGIDIHERTIGKIIKAEGLTRKYRVRKLKYKYIKVPLAKGDLMEIDVKFVPDLIGRKRYFQFTAIDCATRWRCLAIYDDMGNGHAIAFVKELLSIAPFRIRAVKTDNGGCFTNRYTGYQKSSDPLNARLHPFDLFLMENNIIHYLIDPGKPAQNGKVERSHRTDQEMFYDRRKFKTVLGLKRAVKQWNEQYNNLEHCALNGLTPNEALLNN
ncbi:MAG: integrase core domain-containing protein [Candidatus Falkowbacteria bacterium]